MVFSSGIPRHVDKILVRLRGGQGELKRNEDVVMEFPVFGCVDGGDLAETGDFAMSLAWDVRR